MYSPTQIWAFVIAVFGLILTVLNIIDKAISMKGKADAPIKSLEDRVKILEVRLDEHERSLQDGRDVFREQRESNEVMQSCMLALIDFELSYVSRTDYAEDITDLVNAKNTLRKHLAHK